MHMLTLPQFARNNLVHNADQIANSYAENFACYRSALKLGGGDDENW